MDRDYTVPVKSSITDAFRAVQRYTGRGTTRSVDSMMCEVTGRVDCHLLECRRVTPMSAHRYLYRMLLEAREDRDGD